MSKGGSTGGCYGSLEEFKNQLKDDDDSEESKEAKDGN